MDNWLLSKKDQMVSDLQGLLRIPSVKGTPEDNAPFGGTVRRALDYTLELAQELGFRTVNNDGYYGYAEIGQGEPLLGILVHLDVVPEGDGWTYPPFEAQIDNGKIYARGAVDDKGPAIAVLYALKAAEMKGLKGRVRIIFGCDEESGWGCMDKYAQCEEAPQFSFSPDANYPLINTEKCILHLKAEGRFNNEWGLSLHGGTRPNVVPHKVVLKTDNMELADRLLSAGGVSEDGEIVFMGKNAHASTPEQGINALFAPINALASGEGETAEIFRLLRDTLADKIHGEGFDLNARDAESGQLTVNLGIMDVEGERISFVLDFRIPLCLTHEQVLKRVKECLSPFEISVLSHQPSHHISAESGQVKTLLAVYNEITQLPAVPRFTGGGTYARAFENAVAFGPLLPNREDVAHRQDEYISIDDLLLNARIYAHSILRLMNC